MKDKGKSIVAPVDFSGVVNCTCDHIACVCNIKARHKKDCKFRKAATCAVGIECDHGYDVCPICDPCNCGEKND